MAKRLSKRANRKSFVRGANKSYINSTKTKKRGNYGRL